VRKTDGRERQKIGHYFAKGRELKTGAPGENTTTEKIVPGKTQKG